MNGAIDFTRAVTIDTLGLPSVDNRLDDPAAARARATTLEVMRRDPPGQQMQDRFGQARLGYQNHVYLAINTLMDWMGAATFTVQSKADKNIQKAMGSSSSVDSEWHPVPDEHPAAELFANPNENQTFGDYVAQRTMCRQLFGLSYEWIVKDRGGCPRETYVLLPQYVTALPISPQYPFGAIQLSVPQPMYGLNYAGYTRIDRRNVLIHRMPNPMFPWDGYSPLTAGGQMCDVLGSVIAARKKSNDTGLSLEALIKLQGAGDDEVKRVKAQIKDKYSGIDRGDKYMVTNADEIDVELLSTTPDKMAFAESYKDSINFVLALFGVPPALAGLTEATSYAQLFAAIKQFCTGKLGAELRNTAQFWTQKLIRPAWPGCKGNYEPPSIQDEETALQRIAQLDGLQGVGITVNEARAANQMKPIDGGDVTPMEYKAMIAARVQDLYPPAAQPAMPGQPAQPGVPQSQPAPEGDSGDEDESAYPNQLMSHVMSAFGVDAPDAQQANGDDETVLENEPDPVMQKSLAVFYRKSKDASGHEHKGKGKGGGQFGSGGGDRSNDLLDEAMSSKEDKSEPSKKGLRDNDLLDEAFDPKPKEDSDERHPSRLDGVTYGHADDRDADDKAKQAAIVEYKEGVKKIGRIKAKIASLEKKQGTKPDVAALKEKLAAATEKVARAKATAAGRKPLDRGTPIEAKPEHPAPTFGGKPVKIPSTPAMDASGEFDTPDPDATLPSGKPKPETQADAHPAAILAKEAAKKIPAAQKPIARIAVAKLKQSPIPATPLAHRQAANPEEWMPKVLAIAVPVLAKAMGLDRGAATALLTFGLAAALHQISMQNIPVVRPVKGKGGKPTALKPKIHGSTVIPTAKPIRQAVPIPVAKRVGTSGPPQPKNAAGKGSLPKRMGKSLELRAEIADYFATMLGEVCPA